MKIGSMRLVEPKSSILIADCQQRSVVLPAACECYCFLEAALAYKKQTISNIKDKHMYCMSVYVHMYICMQSFGLCLSVFLSDVCKYVCACMSSILNSLYWFAVPSVNAGSLFRCCIPKCC